MSFSNCSPQDSSVCVEKEEILWMTSRGQCLPETGLTHMNSETMTACTTLHSLKPNKTLAPRKRNRHKVPPFTKSYLQLIPTGKVKSHFFFLKDYHWVY